MRLSKWWRNARRFAAGMHASRRDRRERFGRLGSRFLSNKHSVLMQVVSPVFLFLLAGCVHGVDDGDVVLTTIGDNPVTLSEFELYIQGGWAGTSLDEIRTNATARNAALDAFFDLQVMAAKARLDGIDRNPMFRKAAELMEMKLLVQAITDRDRTELLELAKDASGAGKRGYMDKVFADVEMEPTALATNDAPLAFTGMIESNAVLASLGGTPILESDFQWFLKDAFRPEQRPYVFGQPGARQRLVHGYLSMRALEAKARKDGLDQEPDFISMRCVTEDRLLAEFLLERDHMMPWQQGNDLESREKIREYLDQMRCELEFNSLRDAGVWSMDGSND